MRRNFHRCLLAGFVLVPLCGIGAVADRVAVVIDKTVITESEVLDELRLTEFLNNQQLDLGPAARRMAADHLVDQQLIRDEMKATGYAQPTADADEMLRNFRRQHFQSDAAYRAALERYDITEDQLKERLIWQVAALRFADFRFGSEASSDDSRSADRADGSAADDQMTTWLKQAHKETKITFKAEAFE